MSDSSARPSSPSEAPAAPATDRLTLLAVRATAGDLPATAALLEALAPRIATVVRVIMGRGHPDTDDVVQQALIAFLQALPAFRGECAPAGYASRIAVRTAVAARKRSRRDRAREQLDLDAELHASAALSPGEERDAARRREVLRALLTEIPEEQAETLALRVVLGWSLDEVAAATGVPVNTVRSRIRLAREALRRRIEADPRLVLDLELSS